MKSSKWVFALGVVLCLIGFSSIVLANDPLGVTEDYVLNEPLEVQVGPDQITVTLPAGTRLKQTFFKGHIAFIEVSARADRGDLSDHSRIAD